MPPVVSVVVPTYNAPALLRETLATVVAQTLSDFELIVVDDGSTDETPQVLAAIGDPRLRVVRQPNAGIGAARNRGIDESRGTYVATLDHDDLWHPEKLATQVAFMRAHLRCTACATPWEKTSRPGVAVVAKSDVAEADGFIADPVAALADGHDFLITSCLMFDRARAAGARYATRADCVEDTPFQLELFARGPFGIAGDRPLMTYRVHPTNYSKRAAFFYNGQRLLREMTRAGAFDGLPRASLDRYLARTGRTAVRKAIVAGERGAAAALFLREWSAQVRDGRWKFVATVPALLVAPTSLARRVFAS